MFVEVHPESMTTLDGLLATKARLDSPEKWTRLCLARTKKLTPVLPDSTKAVCWCLKGAVQSVCGTSVRGVAVQDRLAQAILILHPDEFVEPEPMDQIINFNDKRTYEEVVQVIDKAIEIETGGITDDGN